MCCRTSPLSWMNSLVRFQSWVVVTAKFSLSRNCFSKIFYYVPVKVRLACGSALTDHLDYIPRLGAYGSHSWGCYHEVGHLGEVYVFRGLRLFGIGGPGEEEVWDDGVFGYVGIGGPAFSHIFHQK